MFISSHFPLGPVIGPLVMCGYMISDKKETMIRRMGARDSKTLSPGARERLAAKLEKISDDHVVLKLGAEEIDVSEKNLNRLEIEKMAEAINLIEPDRVIIDSVEANTWNFRRKVISRIDRKLVDKIEIIAENFADKNYPVVSAASIIAKVHRDADIRDLHKKYGNFGTGYPHDPLTINFLKKWIEKNRNYPPCVRRTWITAISIKNTKEQKRLISFTKGSKD